MLPNNNNNQEAPSCGVVVEKNEQGEKTCSEPASDIIYVANPDDLSQISAVVLVCKKHSADFDKGKTMIFAGENKDHIIIEPQQKEGNNVTIPTNESA